MCSTGHHRGGVNCRRVLFARERVGFTAHISTSIATKIKSALGFVVCPALSEPVAMIETGTKQWGCLPKQSSGSNRRNGLLHRADAYRSHDDLWLSNAIFPIGFVQTAGEPVRHSRFCLVGIWGRHGLTARSATLDDELLKTRMVR